MWIPNIDGRSVEHFRPKTAHPGEAYEWSNYRLVFGVLNGCKGDYEDVLDPFAVEDGWFVLGFPSLLVTPSPDVADDLKAQIQDTIDRLHLNDEDKALKDRLGYVKAFCLNQVNLEFLQERAPFIARELARQGLIPGIAEVMGF